MQILFSLGYVTFFLFTSLTSWAGDETVLIEQAKIAEQKLLNSLIPKAPDIRVLRHQIEKLGETHEESKEAFEYLLHVLNLPETEIQQAGLTAIENIMREGPSVNQIYFKERLNLELEKLVKSEGCNVNFTATLGATSLQHIDKGLGRRNLC